MNKWQAQQSFWSSFGLTAYDEITVPENAIFPYITYEAVADDFGHPASISASLWYKSMSWQEISQKADEIADAITMGGKMYPYKDSAILVRKSNPFAQRMSEPTDDTIRRMVLNVTLEFLE